MENKKFRGHFSKDRATLAAQLGRLTVSAATVLMQILGWAFHQSAD